MDTSTNLVKNLKIITLELRPHLTWAPGSSSTYNMSAGHILNSLAASPPSSKGCLPLSYAVMLSPFFTLMLFALPVLSSPALEKRGTYYIDGCDASLGDGKLTKAQVIQNSLKDMQDLAFAAVGASEASLHSAAQLAWFGAEDGQRVTMEKINTRYTKMANFLSNVPVKDVHFDCSSPNQCCNAGK